MLKSKDESTRTNLDFERLPAYVDMTVDVVQVDVDICPRI